MILRKRYYNSLLFDLTDPSSSDPPLIRQSSSSPRSTSVTRGPDQKQQPHSKEVSFPKRSLIYLVCNTEIIVFVVLSELVGTSSMGVFTLYETECLIYLFVLPVCILTYKKIEPKGGIGTQTTVFFILCRIFFTRHLRSRILLPVQLRVFRDSSHSRFLRAVLRRLLP